MRRGSRKGRAGRSQLSDVTGNEFVIEPPTAQRVVDWKELWRYRHLCWFMVLRDIKVRYAQTVLGLGWAILRPVVNMIVFSVVFGGLAKVPSDGIPYPLFSYAALVPWTYFSTSVSTSASSLIGNSLLSKVYFPRLLIPLSPVLSNLVDFLASLALVGVLMAWYGVAPSWNVLFLPLLVILMILTACGIGMWLSALAVQYRDINLAVSFLIQLLMYAAPVVWPSSLIPAHLRWVYGLYPMAGVVEGFRSALIGQTAMPWDLILPGSVTAVLVWATGTIYFRHRERVFADVL